MDDLFIKLRILNNNSVLLVEKWLRLHLTSFQEEHSIGYASDYFTFIIHSFKKKLVFNFHLCYVLAMELKSKGV